MVSHRMVTAESEESQLPTFEPQNHTTLSGKFVREADL